MFDVFIIVLRPSTRGGSVWFEMILQDQVYLRYFWLLYQNFNVLLAEFCDKDFCSKFFVKNERKWLHLETQDMNLLVNI